MNICIGIISYLPDEPKAREVRRARALRLVDQCNRLYKLPIIFVAQNWDPYLELPGCNVFQYDKLGITGARKKLRELFLFSHYDYLIMLDDDMELVEDPNQIKQYINLIYSMPAAILEYQNFLLNMFGIPKIIFEKEPYDNIEAEKGEGFEDWIYVSRLKKKYKNNYFRITNLNLLQHSRHELVEDEFSTWITPETNKDEMTQKSLVEINKVK